MPINTDYIIKDAVYTTLAGASFYYAAKVLNIDTNAALIIGTGIGHILAVNSKIKNYDPKISNQ